MIKNIFSFITALAIIFITPTFTNAETTDNNQEFLYTCFIKKELSEEAEQLNEFLSNYFNALKSHNIEDLKTLYASNFVSGDGFNKKKMIQMIEDSWNISPELSHSNSIQNIKFDKTFASVEIQEELYGQTINVSAITGDNGEIESTSRIIIYLRKYGKGWKIITDKTLYEETSIKYGIAKDVSSNIFAPEQVFANEDYTISVETAIPEEMFAVGSIVKENLEHPKKEQKELFRQIPQDIKLLERVVKANKDSKNELAVASISYCKIAKDSFKKPDINLAGTAVLLKRVNVTNINASK